MTKYRTVDKLTEGFYKEKNSKFIAYAIACYSENDVKNNLDIWRKKHPQAGHLCYAYRLGLEGAKYRANDDGEPSNSAGAPILGQIDSFNLTNVLIGVVRYYGGVNLGVGGLITAYRSVAKDAIENGEIVELEVHQWFTITFNYEDMPHVMNFLKKQNIPISEKKFEIDCELKIELPLSISDHICSTLLSYSSLKMNDLGIY
ncbi:MAG: YigZ family protein [Fluviicola sp.]|nr:YigZ family protein [Fluviicola sp.]